MNFVIQKKGAVTIFIILGLLATFAVLGTVYVVQQGYVGALFGESPETAVVRAFVESCLEQAGRNAVYFVSLQGGYYDVPSPKKSYSYIDIPVYWFGGKQSLPSERVIGGEIFKYVKRNIPLCLGNFSRLSARGFFVEPSGSIDGSAALTPTGVSINLKYPLRVTKGESSSTLEKVSTIIPINLGEKYEYVKDALSAQGAIPNDVSIGFITNLAHDNNFTFETLSIDKNSIIFSFVFDDAASLGQPLVYSYASQYNWSNAALFKVVEIELMPTFTLNKSTGVFTYQVRAKGSNLKFSDRTALFDIHPQTGVITFDPLNGSSIPTGEKFIPIIAEDSKGNKDLAYLHIVFNFENLLPVITPIGTLKAQVGKEFSYTVKASDPDGKFLYYSDNSPLFTIDEKTGVVRFTPTTAGVYTVKVRVLNRAGSVAETMTLEVS